MIGIMIPNFFFQSRYNLKKKPMFLNYYFLFFEDLSQLFQTFFDYLIDCKILIFLSFNMLECFSLQCFSLQCFSLQCFSLQCFSLQVSHPLSVSAPNKKKQYLYIFYFKFLIDNLNRLF